MTALLSARNLTVVREGRSVVRADALDVGEGARVAIMGPNGSGKSTLLRLLALLEPPTTGTVAVRGEVAEGHGPHLGALRREMASAFQAPLLADTTVYANVALGLRFRGCAESDVRRRVGGWLERFGIGALADRRARGLSGGEAQRVSLARAFAIEPALLLLDEPFGALDAPSRAALLDDIDEILRGARTAVVFVTHDCDEALRVGRELVLVSDGCVIAAGAAADVYAAPGTRAAAELLGYRVLQAPGRSVAVPAGALRLGVGGRTAFDLVVRRDVDLGHERRLFGTIGDVPVSVAARPAGDAMAPGTRITVSTDTAVGLDGR